MKFHTTRKRKKEETKVQILFPNPIKNELYFFPFELIIYLFIPTKSFCSCVLHCLLSLPLNRSLVSALPPQKKKTLFASSIYCFYYNFILNIVFFFASFRSLCHLMKKNCLAWNAAKVFSFTWISVERDTRKIGVKCYILTSFFFFFFFFYFIPVFLWNRFFLFLLNGRQRHFNVYHSK